MKWTNLWIPNKIARNFAKKNGKAEDGWKNEKMYTSIFFETGCLDNKDDGFTGFFAQLKNNFTKHQVPC